MSSHGKWTESPQEARYGETAILEVKFRTDERQIDSKFLEDPLFQRVMKDALEMRDRFSAEPVYAKTGKGCLKSEGVADLQRIMEPSKRYREGGSDAPH